MSTENSTPSDATAENTSADELANANTSPETELETGGNGAENEDTTGGDGEETPKTAEGSGPGGKGGEDGKPEGAGGAEPDKLIFGKYKSLAEAEKAYKEAEKAFAEKAEYEKQLQVYRDLEARQKLEAETLARQSGFGSVEEQNLANEVKDFEFRRYIEALETGYAGDKYDEALQALKRYQQTLNPADLAQAKSCFGPEAVEIIASNTALFKAQKADELAKTKQQAYQTEIRGKLEEFAKETGDWLDVPERGRIVAAAINLAGREADLPQVKAMVEALENKAVERFKAEQKAAAENQSQLAKLETPGGGGAAVPGRKIFTREQFNSLSDSEYEQNYDLIAEQIELEKAGKLPRNLT